MKKGLILLLLFFSVSLYAQVASRQVVVGLIAHDEPVSFFDNQQPKGIAYDFMQAVAKKNNWSLIVRPLEDEQQGIAQLAQGTIDIIAGAVAPIPSDDKSYSLPFLIDHVAVATTKKEMIMEHLWRELEDTFFWDILIFSLVGQVLFSFCLWLSEFRYHPEFQRRTVFKGIALANWAIISAFLRDLIFEPKTARGRFVMGVWLLCSVIFMTVLASSVTVSIIRLSDNNVSFVRSKADLNRQKIGVHAHQALVDLLNQYDVELYPKKTEAALFSSLFAKEVNVIVDHAIMLDYYIKHHKNDSIVKADINLRSDYFSFVTQAGDSLLGDVNKELLELQASGGSQLICQRYLSDHISNCAL